MTIRRVLVLVHKDLVPPEAPPPADIENAPWKMEWDVVSTLRQGGYELRVIGVHDDLTPIRQNVEEFKPDIVFNLMEAFADVGQAEFETRHAQCSMTRLSAVITRAGPGK